MKTCGRRRTTHLRVRACERDTASDRVKRDRTEAPRPHCETTRMHAREKACASTHAGTRNAPPLSWP